MGYTCCYASLLTTICFLFQEKRRLYEEQKQKMEKQNVSFLDSIRSEYGDDKWARTKSIMTYLLSALILEVLNL